MSSLPEQGAGLRKMVVELYVKPDTPEKAGAREALEHALREYVIEQGERFEIVHDESGPSC